MKLTLEDLVIFARLHGINHAYASRGDSRDYILIRRWVACARRSSPGWYARTLKLWMNG